MLSPSGGQPTDSGDATPQTGQAGSSPSQRDSEPRWNDRERRRLPPPWPTVGRSRGKTKTRWRASHAAFFRLDEIGDKCRKRSVRRVPHRSESMMKNDCSGQYQECDLLISPRSLTQDSRGKPRGRDAPRGRRGAAAIASYSKVSQRTQRWWIGAWASRRVLGQAPRNTSWVARGGEEIPHSGNGPLDGLPGFFRSQGF